MKIIDSQMSEFLDQVKYGALSELLDQVKYKLFKSGQAAIEIHDIAHTATGRIVAMEFGFRDTGIRLQYVAGRFGRIDTLKATRDNKSESLPAEFRGAILNTLRHARKDIETQISAEIALVAGTLDAASPHTDLGLGKSPAATPKLEDVHRCVKAILAAALLKSAGFSSETGANNSGATARGRGFYGQPRTKSSLSMG